MSKAEQNPLEQEIAQQMNAQRNRITNEKEETTFFTKIGKIFGVIMVISIILGLLSSLINLW